MEKVREPHRVSYPMLMLFREDLEELVGYFDKNSEDVEIIADEYKLQSISEIDKLGKEQIAHFSVKGRQKKPEYASITLTLEKNSARLYLSEDAQAPLYGIASLGNYSGSDGISSLTRRV